MILDRQNLLALDQAVTASAASTDYLDLGVARDLGIGRPGSFLVSVSEAVTAGGAATVAISLQCDDNTSFSSAKTVVQTDVLAKTVFTAGYQLYLPFPVGLDERYIRAYFTVATGPLTAGKFTVAFVQGEQKNKQYPDALAAL